MLWKVTLILVKLPSYILLIFFNWVFKLLFKLLHVLLHHADDFVFKLYFKVHAWITILVILFSACYINTDIPIITRLLLITSFLWLKCFKWGEKFPMLRVGIIDNRFYPFIILIFHPWTPRFLVINFIGRFAILKPFPLLQLPLSSLSLSIIVHCSWNKFLIICLLSRNKQVMELLLHLYQVRFSTILNYWLNESGHLQLHVVVLFFLIVLWSHTFNILINHSLNVYW